MKQNKASFDTQLTVIPTSKSQVSEQPNRINSGFVLAAVANILWGTSFLATKYTLVTWEPLTASTLRFALALIMMLAIAPIVGQKIRRPDNVRVWKYLFAVGVTGFGALYSLQLSGLTLITSSLSASIMLTSPLFILIFGAVLLGDRFSTIKLYAVALGLFGGLLLLNPSSAQLSVSGALMTFCASVSLALSVIFTRQISKLLDSFNITFWSMLIGFIFLAPFSITEAKKAFEPQAFQSSVFALIYLASVCSVFCFMIWNKAIHQASPKELASTMHIKTPVAILLGLTLAREGISSSIILGTTIVAVAVWLSQQNSLSFFRAKNKQ
jgi:drug/metabolite transporter (DMT)-like permease